MKIRCVPLAVLAACALVACSASDEMSVDATTTSEQSSEISAEEPATETDAESVTEIEAAPTTTTSVEEERSPETTMPSDDVVETTAPSTSTSEVTGESMDDELALIEILGVKVGAGSGEYEVVVAGRPVGFERFKVSLSGADGYCTPEQFDNQGVDNADGSVRIYWYSDTCAGRTVGVAWVHVDGRRSGISYHTCEGGVSLTGELC